MTPASLSQERYEAVDYTALVSGDGYSILIKYPTSTLSPSATFDVFSNAVRAASLLAGINQRCFKCMRFIFVRAVYIGMVMYRCIDDSRVPMLSSVH